MRIHFLGIGGSGASAAAAIAISQGYQVTGCDKNPYTEFTKDFNRTQLFPGHSKEHIKDIDLLAVTPAVFSLDPNNEELVDARQKNIPILTWQQFMGKYLQKDKFVIAVCGTHGKSTTTAMAGSLLEDAGFDPTVELGAIVPKWQANYRVGKGKYFVTEADEFNDNFLSFIPDIAIITNIEMDHPEYFKDITQLKASFKKFLSSTKSKIIANITDPGVSEVLKGIPAADYSKNKPNLTLKIPGKHNLSNAMAVFQLGLKLGIEPKIIKQSLENYAGLGRRFEYLGKFRDADVYSDFAHHPTELKVTLEAAREKFPDKTIWVFFQPHMFTRTKVLFDDFVQVFRNLPADQIRILDIYPSREIDTGLVKSEQLVQSTNKDNVQYNSPEQLKETLNRDIKKDDILFFVGAGDIDSIARKLVKK